jgi:hypothetical protein
MSANGTEKSMAALSHKGNTARIRQLNDAFRRTFTGGRVMLTAGFFLWREFRAPRRIATPAA